MKTNFIFAGLICGCVASLHAAPLSESTFTEVVCRTATSMPAADWI